jgi:hypothetical protein
MKTLFWILGCLIVLAVGLVFSIPTILCGLEGGFRWREEAAQLSPVGMFKDVASQRVAFPALDLVAPAVQYEQNYSLYYLMTRGLNEDLTNH